MQIDARPCAVGDEVEVERRRAVEAYSGLEMAGDPELTAPSCDRGDAAELRLQMGSGRSDVHDVECRRRTPPLDAVEMPVVDRSRRKSFDCSFDEGQGDRTEVARDVIGARVVRTLGDHAVVESDTDALLDIAGFGQWCATEVHEHLVGTHHEAGAAAGQSRLAANLDANREPGLSGGGRERHPHLHEALAHVRRPGVVLQLAAGAGGAELVPRDPAVHPDDDDSRRDRRRVGAGSDHGERGECVRRPVRSDVGTDEELLLTVDDPCTEMADMDGVAWCIGGEGVVWLCVGNRPVKRRRSVDVSRRDAARRTGEPGRDVALAMRCCGRRRGVGWMRRIILRGDTRHVSDE